MLAATLTLAAPAAGRQVELVEAEIDHFGVVLTSASDLDSDGAPDVWVGDPSVALRVGESACAVWGVSTRTGVVIRRISPPEGTRGFGFSLADLADVDGDGVRDVAIGCLGLDLPSPGSDELATAGAVFVVSGADGRVLHTILGVPEAVKDPGCTSHGGPALAAIGDWDEDGIDDLAIGWALDGYAVLESGRVEVVSGRDGVRLATWTGEQRGERFGFELAVVPDLDGDGQSDLAASAVPEHALARTAFDGGFVRALGGYVQLIGSKAGPLRTLRPANWSKRFGSSIAAVREHDGRTVLHVGRWNDLQSDPVVTAWYADTAELRTEMQGSAWPRKSALEVAHVTALEMHPSFGARIVAVTDRDGDGDPDLLVTAPDSMTPTPAYIVSTRSGAVLAEIEFTGLAYDLASHVGIAACALDDFDKDAYPDFAIGGASTRCGSQCRGVVLLVSGKSAQVVRVLRREDLHR